MLLSCHIPALKAQIITQKFGNGVKFLSSDSTFYSKMNLRIQSLMSNSWSLDDGQFQGYESNMLLRRSRLKFEGWAINPNLFYKFEMGLSNRDHKGDSEEFNNTSNLILDAFVQYKFYKNLSVRFGQGKLESNRERVISSGNLQFVDRSLLNSRFNIDRDFALSLYNYHTTRNGMVFRESFAISQGEGRNVTIGNLGGNAYTFSFEFLPFGFFKSKGDYVNAAIKYEETPKLSLAATYQFNNNAARNRGQLGSFLEENGTYYGKDLNVYFVDIMFKYKNWSLMSEYAKRETTDDSPFVYSVTNNLVGTFYTGSAVNTQVGYMFKNNYEIAGRFTTVNPQEGVDEKQDQYTLGFSKYITGHKLKIQTDLTYIDHLNKLDGFSWRTQVEFQF